MRSPTKLKNDFTIHVHIINIQNHIFFKYREESLEKNLEIRQMIFNNDILYNCAYRSENNRLRG